MNTWILIQCTQYSSAVGANLVYTLFVLHTYSYKKVLWIDLEMPTPEEIQLVVERHGLDPLVAEELATKSARTKIERYKNGIFLVMNFPIARSSGRDFSIEEIDFFVGRDFIITTRYNNVDPLHRFAKHMQNGHLLTKDGIEITEHGGFLFFHMLRSIYEIMHDELMGFSQRLSHIERRTLSGEEREMVLELSRAGRDIIDFRQALTHHKEILTTYEQRASTPNATGSLVSHFNFGVHYGAYARALIGEFYKVSDLARSHSELIGELRATNDSLLAAKQGETTKLFTVMAFTTFPLALFVAIADYHSPWNPFMDIPYNFHIVVGIVILAVLIMLISFRGRKWL